MLRGNRRKYQMKKLTTIGAAIAASALLLSAPAAQASLIIQASLDGVTYTDEATTASGGTLLGVTFDIGTFRVVGSEATSNSPGNPAFSNLISNALTVTNNGGGTLQVFFQLRGPGLYQPQDPPNPLFPD